MPYVFAYGTLRPRGIPAREIVHGHSLYDYGKYPYALPRKGGSIHGLLCEVSNTELKELDAIEGVKWNLFERVEVNVFSKESPELSQSAYMYVAGSTLLGTIDKHIPVLGGDWVERHRLTRNK